MTRSTQELIAAADAHLDASDQSQFSTANGIELLAALKREAATVERMRGALEKAVQFVDHTTLCCVGKHNACTCGFDAMYAELDAALSPPPSGEG